MNSELNLLPLASSHATAEQHLCSTVVASDSAPCFFGQHAYEVYIQKKWAKGATGSRSRGDIDFARLT